MIQTGEKRDRWEGKKRVGFKNRTGRRKEFTKKMNFRVDEFPAQTLSMRGEKKNSTGKMRVGEERKKAGKRRGGLKSMDSSNAGRHWGGGQLLENKRGWGRRGREEGRTTWFDGNGKDFSRNFQEKERKAEGHRVVDS